MTFYIVVIIALGSCVQMIYPASFPKRGNASLDNKVAFSNISTIQAYLIRYGYMSAISNTNSLISLTRPLLTYQKFANITPTGRLDSATLQMIRKTRCGNRDIYRDYGRESGVRIKRNVQGSKWLKRHLTFKVSTYTQDLSRAQIDDIIENAFQIWSDVTPLSFTPSRCDPVDIDISFTSGYHGDNLPFDGQGGVLAHAFSPGSNTNSFDGDAHFDDDEIWEPTSNSHGTSLLSVMIHELGHSLGLLHSSEPSAIMWAWYSDKTNLDTDDITRIQLLYGSPGSNYGSHMSTPPPARCIPTGGRVISSRRYHVLPPLTTIPIDSTTTTTTTNFKSPPTKPPRGLCSGRIDAVFLTPFSQMYLFIDTDAFIKTTGVSLRPVNQMFIGGPHTVDAAFSVTMEWREVKIYLIKGTLCWRYTKLSSTAFQLDASYPRSAVQVLGHYARHIDAIYSINGNGFFCVLSGDRYWYVRFYGTNVMASHFYSSKNHIVYSKIRPITAAFRSLKGVTYFFVGDQYYKYNVSRGIPRLTGPKTAVSWFGCKNTSYRAENSIL